MIRIFCLAILAIASTLWADPRQWAEEGVAVSMAQVVEEVNSATNPDGYSLSVWAGSNGDLSVVMGQMVSPTGETLWESSGRLLAAGSERAGYPDVIAVENGWMVGWLDATYIEWCDGPILDGSWCLEAAVRVIKLDNNGSPLWGSERSGVEIVPTREFASIHPFVLHSSNGGAIITWGQSYENVPLKARGIGADGIAWPEAVEVSGNLHGTWLDVTSDLQGGLLIAWTRGFYQDSIVHANRLLSTGELAWAGAEGLAIVSTHDTVSGAQIAADGSGGMYLGWSTGRYTDELWVQRFNSSGEAVWTMGGVRPCVGNGTVYIEDLVSSMNGDQTDGVIALLASRGVQKLSPDGTRLWGNCGTAICDDSGSPLSIQQLKVVSDLQGGAILSGLHEVIDENSNFLYYEARVARVSADGNSPWADGCVIAGNAYAYYPKLEPPMVTNSVVRSLWYENGVLQVLSTRDIALNTGTPLGDTPTTVFSATYKSVRDMKSVKLNNGATAWVWLQSGYESSSAHFQILDVFGEPLLNTDGAPLLQLANGDLPSVVSVAACEDGSGGFFGFATVETATNIEIYSVHISGAGEFLSDNTGTLVLASAGINANVPLFALADGTGGAFVCGLLHNQQFGSVLGSMRVDATGDPAWTDPFLIDAGQFNIYPNGLTLGHEHACLLVYSEETSYPVNKIHSVLVNSNGTQEWSTTLTDSALYTASDLSVCSNSFGGAYVAWVEEMDGTAVLVVQNVSDQGQLVWENGGVILGSTANHEVYPSCEADVLGNLTIAWNTWPWSDANLRAQRLTAAGQVLWGANGITISDARQNQFNSDVVVVSDNEIYIVWQDLRDDPFYWIVSKTYATHLNARGEIAGDSWWQVGGNDLAPAGFSQREPMILNDGMGGVVVAWLDQRAGFSYENNSLFTQRLYDPIFTDADDVPVVPTEFSLSQNYPNPFNPETMIEFALPTSSKALLKIFDVTGREVAMLVDEPLSAGTHRVQFNAQSLPSGVYFYTLRSADQTATRKMMLLR